MSEKTVLYTQRGCYVIYNDSSEIYRGVQRNSSPIGTCIGAVEHAKFEGVEANSHGEFTVDKSIQGRVLRQLRQLPVQTLQHPVVAGQQLLIILPVVTGIETRQATREINLEKEVLRP
jgi:hypothetical protein